MIKTILLLTIPLLIAGSPILKARWDSFWCEKCNDENWMSEGGNCGHGAYLWGMMATIPAGLIVALLILIFFPWI